MAAMERAHIGRIERGENQPSLGIILKLAKALGSDPGKMVNEAAAAMRLAQ